MLTLHTARIGVPSELNRVNFALTEVTNAGKLEIEPQCSTTSGGDGFFWPALSSVGTQQDSRVSTALTTEPSWVAVASKNISKVIFDGSGAGELGRTGLLRALGRLAFPLGRLGDRDFLGVELERHRAALGARARRRRWPRVTGRTR